MNNTLKRAVSLLLISTSVISFSSCSSNSEKLLKSSSKEQDVVKTIDDFDVPMEMYRYFALNYKASYEIGKSSDIWLGEEGEVLLEKLEDNINTALIKVYAPLTLCDDYGIDYTSPYIIDTVDFLMDNIYEGYNYDYKSYISDIETYNMNDAVYRFMIRNDILADELIAVMMQNGDIVYEEDAVREVFASDELIRFKQILIEYDPDKTEEENIDYVETIMEKVENGEDFDKLVQEYGQDLYMFSNTDGYYITRGQYQQNFEDAVFSLEIGEHSQIVETAAGYSIIKRYEKEDVYIEKNFDALSEQYVNNQYNLILEEQQESISVTDTKKLADYSVFNLKMN